MKKMLLALACAVTVAAVVAVAAPKTSADGAAVIKNDGLCGMVGSDADGNQIFGGIGQVTTDVKNANQEMLSCKGSGIANDSGRGQHFDGFLCGTFSGLTTDSHATVTPSGQATLTCIVHF